MPFIRYCKSAYYTRWSHDYFYFIFLLLFRFFHNSCALECCVGYYIYWYSQETNVWNVIARKFYMVISFYFLVSFLSLFHNIFFIFFVVHFSSCWDNYAKVMLDFWCTSYKMGFKMKKKMGIMSRLVTPLFFRPSKNIWTEMNTWNENFVNWMASKYKTKSAFLTGIICAQF